MNLMLSMIVVLSVTAVGVMSQPPGGGPPPMGGGGGSTMVSEPNYNYTASTKNASADPVITKWIKSDGVKSSKYKAYLNVNKVQYSATYVYVSASGLPSYTVGPYPGNPNTESDQGYTFQFPRVPVERTVNKTTVSLNTIGVLLNGVPIFNAEDGMSISGWSRNAFYFEYSSFDSCSGHPQQSGVYHHHAIPNCFNSSYYNDSSKHSPLIGFAIDGFPIYGPFGYSVANNSASSIKRILPSFRLRNITSRATTASGASVTGPVINSTYPLGAFLDDFEFVTGLGDTDVSGGRLCVTPDYPEGTYAYFLPTDSSGGSAYPYTLGLKYYGYVVTANSVSGKVTPTETTTVYFDVNKSSVTSCNGFTIAFLLFLIFNVFF